MGVCVGARALSPIPSGPWVKDARGRLVFPLGIALGKRRFLRAQVVGRYPGVVAQYREAVPTESMHLKVYGSGTWTVDHVDAHNPDAGLLPTLSHFLADYLPPVAPPRAKT